MDEKPVWEIHAENRRALHYAAPRQCQRSLMRVPQLFTELLHMRFMRRDPHLLLGEKMEFSRRAADAGLLCPRQFRLFERVEDLDLRGLPEAFVLKPAELANKRGVMLLQRIGGTTEYHDAMRACRIGEAQIKAEFAAWDELYRVKGVNLHSIKGTSRLHVIAEERVVDEDPAMQIPLDYKLYAFNGEIRLIYHLNRNVTPTGIYFYDGDFRPYDPDEKLECDWKRVSKDVARVPKCSGALIESARKMSKALGMAFVRVDLYASRRGALFGEITTTPGAVYQKRSYRFRPEFDAEMGAAWHKAAKELRQEIPAFEESFFTEQPLPGNIPSKLPAGRREKSRQQ
jgi:hypothetical protein